MNMMRKGLCFLLLLLSLSVFGCGTRERGNVIQPSSNRALKIYRTAFYSISVPTSWSENWQPPTLQVTNSEKSCTILCEGVHIKGDETVQSLASEAKKEFLTPDPEAKHHVLNASEIFLDGKPATRIDMLVTNKKKGTSTVGTHITVRGKNWVLLISVIDRAEDERQLEPTIQTILKSIICVDEAK